MLFRQSSLNALEAVYLLGAYFHMSFQLLFTKNYKFVTVGKSASFILVCGLALIMMMQSNRTGIVLGLSHFWYIAFCLGVEYRSRSSFYWRLVAVTVLLWVPTLSIRLMGDFGTTNHFIDVPYFELIALTTSTMVGFVGIVMSIREALNQDNTVVKSQATLDWFTTLINLVSHNLRSPLASIRGNLEILSFKVDKVKGTQEFERMDSALDVSVSILDRLLKATFITDQSPAMSLEESLTKSYPQVRVLGDSHIETTYEQKVSIQLALEVFLDNAIQYTDGDVKVVFDQNSIVVQDEGPGIPDDLLSEFAAIKGHSVGTLHGIGVPFAVRILDSIQYRVEAVNTYPGLQVRISRIEQ